jgi:predicted transcriptional regulator
MAARRPAGALELEILATLWAEPAPMTAAEVQHRLRAGGHDLAYTTVLTVLTRLHDKGELERSSQHRAHLYRPAHEQAEAVADQMSRALSRGPDRTAVLRAFVSRLEPADQAQLRALLHTHRPPRTTPAHPPDVQTRPRQAAGDPR